MSNIVIRSSATDGWQVAESSVYPNEDYLQKILYESPELIPFTSTGTPRDAKMLTMREFWMKGSGRTDLIVVHATGDISVIECKLATNPEVKREVIGQVLDYASNLWGMSYEDFDRRSQKETKGVSLSDYFAELCGDEDFDGPAFVASVTDTLKAGRFGLIVAVDVLGPSLERITRYIESRSGEALTIFVLEMQYHSTDGLEAITPLIANPVTGTKSSSSSYSSISFEAFESHLSKIDDIEARHSALDLFEFTKQNSYNARRAKGAISYSIDVHGTRRSLITLELEGTFWINVGNLRPHIGDELADNFFDNLSEIDGFSELVSQSRGRRYMKVLLNSPLVNSSNREIFKQMIKDLQAAVAPTD